MKKKVIKKLILVPVTGVLGAGSIGLSQCNGNKPDDGNKPVDVMKELKIYDPVWDETIRVGSSTPRTAHLRNNMSELVKDFKGLITYDIEDAGFSITNDADGNSILSFSSAEKGAGDVEFTITATISGDTEYAGKSKDCQLKLHIFKNELTGFAIDPITITTNVSYPYEGETTLAFGTNIDSFVDHPYEGTVSYKILQNGSPFEIINETQNKAQLKIPSGLNADIYSFTVQAIASGDDYYESETAGVQKTLTINKGEITSDFVVKINGEDQIGYLSSSYSTTQEYGLSNTCSITDGTTFIYEFVNEPDSKISISGSTLNIQPGLSKGDYEFTIKCIARNNNYLDKESAPKTLKLYVCEPISSVDNATDPYIITAKSIGAGWQPFRAFQDSTKDVDLESTGSLWAWCSTTHSSPAPLEEYLDINLKTPQKLVHYWLQGGKTQMSPDPWSGPKTWKIQGSNDGSVWTDLHNGSSETMAPTTENFDIDYSKIAAYQYYRITVTSVNANTSNYVCIRWLKLFTA